MKWKLICILALLIPTTVVPKERDAYSSPILQAIYKLDPTVPSKKAIVIAASIEYCSVDKGIDWRTLVSLAYVESKFNPTIIRKVNGRSIDFGLFQINVLNIKQYKLDKKKLTDAVYNTRAACIVIDDIRKHKPNWVEYYNTGSHSKDIEKKRQYGIKVAYALKELL